jgi:hypothetical protein
MNWKCRSLDFSSVIGLKHVIVILVQERLALSDKYFVHDCCWYTHSGNIFSFYFTSTFIFEREDNLSICHRPANPDIIYQSRVEN